MDTVVAGLAGLCVLSAGLGVGRHREVSRWRAALIGPPADGPPVPGILERVGRGPLGRMAPSSPGLERRMSLAGDRRTPEAVAGLQVLLAAAGAAIGLLLVTARPAAVLLVPLLGWAGIRLPHVALARRARARRAAIARQVLDLVEVLVATTEAGLGPTEAIRRSARALSGPLAEELHQVIRRIDLGAPWREALGALVERTEDPALRRLLVALSRSQRLGTTVRSALRSVAVDLREERRVRTEALARRAPVKMLFPLVLLILPAFLLLTVGPVLMATLRSLRSG